MTKTDVTKAVVRNLTGFVIGSTLTGIIDNNRRHSDNAVLETILAVSTFITSCAVGEVIAKSANQYTDAKIDAIAAWWTKTKN